MHPHGQKPKSVGRSSSPFERLPPNHTNGDGSAWLAAPCHRQIVMDRLAKLSVRSFRPDI